MNKTPRHIENSRPAILCMPCLCIFVYILHFFWKTNAIKCATTVYIHINSYKFILIQINPCKIPINSYNKLT